MVDRGRRPDRRLEEPGLSPPSASDAAAVPDPEDAFVGDILGEDRAQAIVEEYETEGRVRELGGVWRAVAGAIAVGLSLYALYATRATIPTQVYRTSFLGAALVLTFLLYPLRRGGSRRVTVL